MVFQVWLLLQPEVVRTLHQIRHCLKRRDFGGTVLKTLTFRGRHWGGGEKGGGWKTSRMTHLPKRGFGPPLVRYVFHPPQVSVLCFSCTKIHDRADQKLFWRGPEISGIARSLVRFPPPIRFAPPPISQPKTS